MFYLEQVAVNSVHLNYYERTKLLGLIKSFYDLFDGTLGERYTEPADLGLKSEYKPFNCKHYPVPRINRQTFCK